MTSRFRGDRDRRWSREEGADEMLVERDAVAGLAALAALRSPGIPEGAADRIEVRIREAWDGAFGT